MWRGHAMWRGHFAREHLPEEKSQVEERPTSKVYLQPGRREVRI
jgi:hypothetical protein